MNTTATYSRYRFDMLVGSSNIETIKQPASHTLNSQSIAYKSGIEDMGFKMDFEYSPNTSNEIIATSFSRNS